MAGVLSFTLGLEASNFLRNLGMASGGVLSFAGMMQAVNRAASGTWSAIGRGGSLMDLSARTGESVRSLYQLQEAFKLAGLGAEAVPSVLLRVQRAIGGIGQDGNRAGDAMAQLGLDAQRLAQMDGAKQIETIATALQRAGKERGAFLAGKLFGAEGAGDILQITRDMEGFLEAMKESAATAEIYQRMAGAFDNIGDTAVLIKGNIDGMFAGIAEGAATAIQGVLNLVKSVDWVGIGKRIGSAMQVLTQSFVDGKFGELFTLTLQAGVQEASNLMMQEMTKWGRKWAKILKNEDGEGGKVAGSIVEYGVKQQAATRGIGWGLAGLLSEPFALAGVPGMRKFSDFAFDMAWASFTTAGINDGILNTVAEAFTKGINGEPNEFLEKLNALTALLASRVPQDQGKDPNKKNDSPDIPDLSLAPSRPGGSAWEKLGFVLGGGRSSSDHARRTADNTRLMIAEQKRTNALLQQGPRGGSFDRIN